MAVEQRQEIERRPLSSAFGSSRANRCSSSSSRWARCNSTSGPSSCPPTRELAGGLPIADRAARQHHRARGLLRRHPAFAALSDRVGRKPLLYVAAVGFLVLTWPMLRLLRAGGFTTYLAVDIVGILLIRASNSVLRRCCRELFPARVRTSGIGLPYAICSAIFGGTAPLIAAALRRRQARLGARRLHHGDLRDRILTIPSDAGDTRAGRSTATDAAHRHRYRRHVHRFRHLARAAATARSRR